MRNYARKTRFLQSSAQGAVLILTLTVLITLTAMLLLLTRTMRAEAASSANYLAQIQAQAVADGAVEYLRSTLDGSAGKLPDDSTLYTQAVRVGTGYFWLIKHDHPSDQSYTFGINDECAKLNINTATATMLSQLPNMTNDLGACIVDWRDSNDTPLPGGAESTYYLSLSTPYNAKNAFFETVEELLMVKDIPVDVLYGKDTNRNGRLDSSDEDQSSTGLNFNSQLDNGLFDFVTVYSISPNTDFTGKNRVDVNGSVESGSLRQILNSVLGGAELTGVLANVRAIRTSRRFVNVVDFYYSSGINLDAFAKIADRLSADARRNIPGLININSAAREVLACLPRLTDSDVQAILSARQSTTGITDWAALIKILSDSGKARALDGLVAFRSYQCSADIVAVDANGRSFSRMWVVLDTRSSPVKVVYRRDLTSLGWPLDPQILRELHAGKNMDDLSGAISLTSGLRGAR